MDLKGFDRDESHGIPVDRNLEGCRRGVRDLSMRPLNRSTALARNADARQLCGSKAWPAPLTMPRATSRINSLRQRDAAVATQQIRSDHGIPKRAA
jgi:hypothetical protein